MDTKDSRPRCAGTRKDGTACAGIATIDGKWCPAHDPRVSADERKARARRGAAATNHSKLVHRLEATKADEIAERERLNVPSLDTAEKVGHYVEELIALVRAGLLPPSLANSINGLLSTRLKIEELRLDADLAAQLAEAEGSKLTGPRVVNGGDDQ